MARRRRRRGSTAIARRKRSGPSPAFLKLRKKEAAARRRASSIRKKYTGTGAAMKNGTLVIGGGAAGGVATALAPDVSVLGLDSDATLAAALVAAGLYMNKPSFIYMAAGIGAVYAHEWAAETAAGIQAGEPVMQAVGLGG